MWKGLKKAHFSGVLMTKQTNKQTCLVDSTNSWKERSEGCIGNIFQDFGCKMEWWNGEGMLKQGRFFMIGAIYYSMLVSWWKWQENRCYRRKERQFQRYLKGYSIPFSPKRWWEGYRIGASQFIYYNWREGRIYGADAMRLENLVVKDVQVKTHYGDFSVKKRGSHQQKVGSGKKVLEFWGRRQQCDIVMLDNGSMIWPLGTIIIGLPGSTESPCVACGHTSKMSPPAYLFSNYVQKLMCRHAIGIKIDLNQVWGFVYDYKLSWSNSWYFSRGHIRSNRVQCSRWTRSSVICERRGG